MDFLLSILQTGFLQYTRRFKATFILNTFFISKNSLTTDMYVGSLRLETVQKMPDIYFLIKIRLTKIERKRAMTNRFLEIKIVLQELFIPTKCVILNPYDKPFTDQIR